MIKKSLLLCDIALALSCSKSDDITNFSRIDIMVGDEAVVKINERNPMFTDSPHLLGDGICEIKNITEYELTVVALKAGEEELHIEYQTTKGHTGYSGADIPITVVPFSFDRPSRWESRPDAKGEAYVLQFTGDGGCRLREYITPFVDVDHKGQYVRLSGDTYRMIENGKELATFRQIEKQLELSYIGGKILLSRCRIITKAE